MIEEPGVEKTKVIEDTTGIQEEVVTKPSVTAIEESKTEIEKRLEKSLTLINRICKIRLSLVSSGVRNLVNPS